MSATTLNTARPDWFSGQVTVNAQSDFRLILEGKATNGGFAVDQLIFYPGKCESMLGLPVSFKKRFCEIRSFQLVRLVRYQLMKIRPQKSNKADGKSRPR